MSTVTALLFDVFGTVVNWRDGISRDVSVIADQKGVSLDPAAFADSWRAEYQPAMEEVRSGRRSFTILDVLHRENLKKVATDFGLGALSAEDEDFLVTAWHRLPGWPDSSEGMLRLKQKFILGSQSNGNIALIVNMAKYANLPWDVVLGAEVVGHYKPQPEAYLNACTALGLATENCMMVAAHNDDLVAARAAGLKTAFVCRPTEHGIGQTKDLRAEQDWEFVAQDFNDLADKLGL
ncbi:MAG: (S)-2-haloacid dehalogenase 4A [Alphaproteobacteria bacterium UBA4588]|nr:MAG: (S)-2-haloacid dehalogenase 4A [Alphaproteobacteria bacterium UBA4588]